MGRLCGNIRVLSLFLASLKLHHVRAKLGHPLCLLISNSGWRCEAFVVLLWLFPTDFPSHKSRKTLIKTSVTESGPVLYCQTKASLPPLFFICRRTTGAPPLWRRPFFAVVSLMVDESVDAIVQMHRDAILDLSLID